jgi:hypothetical protein
MKINVFLTFCLLMEGSGSAQKRQIREAQKHTDPTLLKTDNGNDFETKANESFDNLFIRYRSEAKCGFNSEWAAPDL